MNPTRRGFLKMLGAAAAAPAAFPLEIKNDPPAAVPPASAVLLSQWPPEITIRALPSNSGSIFVGPSFDRAKDHSKAVILEPGSWVTLSVDRHRIFVDMEVDGDTVHILDGDHLESRG